MTYSCPSLVLEGICGHQHPSRSCRNYLQTREMREIVLEEQRIWGIANSGARVAHGVHLFMVHNPSVMLAVLNFKRHVDLTIIRAKLTLLEPVSLLSNTTAAVLKTTVISSTSPEATPMAESRLEKMRPHKATFASTGGSIVEQQKGIYLTWTLRGPCLEASGW